MLRPRGLRFLQTLGRQDWLSPELRRRLIKKFVNHNRVGSYPFETDFFCMKYRGNLNELMDWFVFFFGAYEKEELFLLRYLLKDKPAPVFIDVGASIGQHALFMSHYCYQVHAFEPYHRARSLLNEKIALNRISNIIVHEVGLGAINESLNFYAPVGHNIGTGSFDPSHRKKNQLIGQLQIRKGDDYLAELNLKSVDLIKIDVEGFEKNVLLGLQQTIYRYRPDIFMECTLTTQKTLTDLQEIIELLPQGYIICEFCPKSQFHQLFSKTSYCLRRLDCKTLATKPLDNFNLLLQSPQSSG